MAKTKENKLNTIIPLNKTVEKIKFQKKLLQQLLQLLRQLLQQLATVKKKPH